MPKKLAKAKNEKFKVITTPSAFGSHKTMLVDTPENLNLEKGQCVCRDDDGLYVTEYSKLDTNLADPNRYSQNRRI